MIVQILDIAFLLWSSHTGGFNHKSMQTSVGSSPQTRNGQISFPSFTSSTHRQSIDVGMVGENNKIHVVVFLFPSTKLEFAST